MFNWDQENDRCSFEDSDQFEEDSLCSWISEPESLCNNWRGWKRTNGGGGGERMVSGTHHPRPSKEDGQVLSLVELAAKEVACHIPFEVVEHVYPPVPEQLQLRIACWSFPENEEDIRLYSCLANGSADEFLRGEHLFKAKAVKDPLQIGFHLSATLVPTQSAPQTKGSYNVAVTFDRRRITSCNCTCSSSASWCAHVVAVCLHRIHLPGQVCLRAPVSESLSRLHRDQLQKFAQYLISELPQQILPTAQRLLDELLSCQQTAINTVCGAPDPTAGASASEQTTWCLDELTLHENIHKILIKFCVPSPIVFSDVNYLSSTAPPAAAEWTSLLRPLRGREPEGMWNLLSIVREMYRRNDRNAMLLLEILTEECLSCEQILLWWFNTKVSLHNGNLGHGGRGGMNSNTHASQHACSSLCDEIVVLWRLAGLNPALSPDERRLLSGKLREWHLKAVDKICRARGAGNAAVGGANGTRRADIDVFTGFKSAIEACLMDWDDYPIPGVTYARGAASRYYLPYCAGSRLQDGHGGAREVSSSAAVLNCEHPAPPPCAAAALGPAGGSKSSRSVGISAHHGHHGHHHHQDRSAGRAAQASPRHSRTSAVVVPPAGGGSSQPHDGNRSSVSSEGFCENETEGPGGSQDSDSVEEPVATSAAAASTTATVSASTTSMIPNFGLASMLLQSSPVGRREEARSGTPPADDILRSQVAAAVAAVMTELTVSSKGNKSSPDEQDSDWSSAPESSGVEKSAAPTAATASSAALHRPVELVVPAAAGAGAAKLEPQQSESQPSSDEYQVYYYDPKAKLGPQERPAKDRKGEEGPGNVFASIRRIEDPLEILFAQAEALHAHGHTREACQLGVKLAEELLANPPDLMVELPPPPTKGKRKKKVNPASHQISCLAGATLSKTAFLCTVLSENPQHYHLAFRVGMYGLEMARPPASTKALEVKLANQETELVNLLKRIPLSTAELTVIREKAEQLRDGKLTSRGDALLPLNLTSFIVDALCLPSTLGRTVFHSGLRMQTDESTGFEAAVAAMGLKANVSEADHPLLCEGTRRQRGDLALALLVHYKDDQEKLAKIMEKLLDKEIHQMYKAPTLSSYYSSKPNQAGHSGSGGAKGGATSQPVLKREGTSESDDIGKPGTFSSSNNLASPGLDEGSVPDLEKDVAQMGLGANVAARGMPGTSGVRAKESVCYKNRCADDKRDDTSSPTWVEDYKAWEAKFRCTNFRTHKKRSAGMASIDSSAPETTSSDNSPTLVRRSGWNKPAGPGSDSGSSGGKSSDSFGSSSSGDKAGRPKVRENESPPPNFAFIRCHNLFGTETIVRSVTPCVKTSRFKGKRSYPSIPNQPSEASAHFMFELAKTVLTKAGGNSSTSLFTQPAANQNHRGPHRALHMCAFQIGLYALGLHNCVSPNWLSRTYSSHVSWITSQALEIGSAAISFLIDTWEGHLTPPEVASLADRASRGRDPNVVGTAAELALSCLPHAHALNPNEIQRAIMQCKEQTNGMLERACLAVEGAAKGGGVYPEVLFDVAHRWHELYNESVPPAVGTADVAVFCGTNVLPGSCEPGGVPLLAPTASSSTPSAAANSLDNVPMSLDALIGPSGLPAAPSGAGEPSLLGGSPPDVSVAPPARLQQQQQQVPQLQQPPPPPMSLLNQVAVTVAHGLPYSVPPPLNTGVSFGPGPLPFSPYLPSFPPHHQGLYGHHHHPMPLPHHGLHPYVAAPFSYSNGAGFALPAQAYYSMPAVTVASQMRTPPPGGLYSPMQLASLQCGQPRPGLMPPQPAQGSMHVMPLQPGLAHHQQQQQATGHPQPRNAAPAAINPTQVNYLLATYRVGMLALETLARRVHDDRPNAKYARNPPYGEDVKWLLGVSKKLGTSYVQQFCLCTVNSVASPFLLQEIAWDAAHYLSRNNPATVVQHLRSPVLTPLVQKCQQMYIQCTHLKMYHLTPGEYEEFVGIIRSARTAFQMTPGGIMQFSEFLQALRRSKTCKKDLWQKIASAIQCGGV